MKKLLKKMKKDLEDDTLLRYSFILMLFYPCIYLVPLLKQYTSNIIFEIVYLVAIIFSTFVLLLVEYTIITKEIRKFNRILNQIDDLKLIDFGFPNDLINSIVLKNQIIKNNHKKVYQYLSEAIHGLNKQETLFALIRIKNYKNPFSFMDTIVSIILFIFGYFSLSVLSKQIYFILALLLVTFPFFLTYYFSYKKKMYICNILKDLLNFHLDELNDEIIKHSTSHI
ncbi:MULTISPECIES: hypothetical protein [unclassified Enterococcus]|uniref:hypothetical protein n=1 Tax=unclassified Enterococcus TaxID=2608891 RepID=UPI0015534F02|nr:MULTISPECIES: hypothetical protein [unclassified Enterococcus]MBS7577158.1 hypothetical protein [Enterococcus sp. MMGLQ5-2]MBS7584395.1 hypothetical protein [Enterococcus sp. MMGLQ5-1]NPD12250.1 hypothetical protein [Enterococcus sp. MMGLQ5-1]NPD36992.1 hypothetical protein [Enterococcus sp. MMGLQ5-2]